MKKQNVTNKQTALEAAQILIQAENQKKVEAASKELDKLVAEWSEKNGCTLVITGQFQGNQIKTGLQVVIKE